MDNVESVEVRDSRRSHWVVRGPAGTKVEWDAEIINEVPNELIAWRSIEGSQIDNAGSVHFAPARDGSRGTELRIILRYDPPAGVLGATVSRILGEDPAIQVEEDLLRLKMLLETGRVNRIPLIAFRAPRAPRSRRRSGPVLRSPQIPREESSACG